MRLYENPLKTSENRLNQRSWYKPEGDCRICNLNGKWKFAYFSNGDKVKNIEEWQSIDVPSCWQLQGYESPNYSNVNYPYPCDPPYVPNINPVGVYERSFEIRDTNEDTYIMFEGVSSCAEVYINGQYVGFTQGSHLEAEFDIGKYVTQGENTVRVDVRKWCCGSYLEDQDFFRFNGIFRDVYVMSRPKGHIFNLDIRTVDNTIICKADKPCRVEVYDSENLIETKQADTGYCEFTIAAPVLWNAEQPYLYTVKFYAAGEMITRKIGFRTIEISPDYELLINGVAVKLKGVNHHDSSPNNGWCMTRSEIINDLKLMKKLNINTIRTSHYPPSPEFLDLCDEMGFYVILETNLESHGFLRRFSNIDYNYDAENEDWPCSNSVWKKEFVERMERAYERDKIHTSIIMWSTGNESGHGINHVEMIKWLKTRDNVRLIHCEDASRIGIQEYTDVYSSMYSSIPTIKDWAKDESIKQPVFLCEYAHSMGNGPGGIWDYWETFYNNKKLIGGCIWEWADHVVIEDGVQKYGGDFKGELTNDSNFCCDGMVFADRSLKAGSLEIKNTYAPFRISWEDGSLKIKNCFDFTSFDDYSFEYNITVDGKSIDNKILKVNISAKDVFTITPIVEIPASCRMGCYITVKMLDRDGNEIGCLQEQIPVAIVKDNKTASPLTVKEDEFEVKAEGENFCYVLSKQTGNFTSICIDGKEQLLKPAKLSYSRACTDNDASMKPLWNNTNIWQGENFDCVFCHIYDTDVNGNKVVFTASAAGVSRKPFFNYRLAFEFFTDGTVKVNLDGRIRENVVWLPRIGFEFKLPFDCDKFRYFGNGPSESYCDMTHHGVDDWHESCADDEYVNYVRPQEHGNHTDCKSLIIENSLKFTPENVMDISVLHNSIEQIEKATHTDELEKSDGTHVRIDYKVSGIGTASCGPALDKKYRLDEKEIKFSFAISI